MRTIENHKKQQFEIETHFRHVFTSHGMWDIECEVTFLGESKKFKQHTTASDFIDTINDMKYDDATSEEIQAAYSDRYFDEFEERALEWCEEISEREQ